MAKSSAYSSRSGNVVSPSMRQSLPGVFLQGSLKVQSKQTNAPMIPLLYDTGTSEGVCKP